jgi:hypothetical protein
MSVLYNQLYRDVPDLDTRSGASYHAAFVRWMGRQGNNAKLYTTRPQLTQWWPGGCSTTAGDLSEKYLGQWVIPFPAPFSRFIVEMNGYAIASGGTQWRLYSMPEMRTNTFHGAHSVAATIVSATESWTAPAHLTASTFVNDDDRRRMTWLVLTGQNLTPSAQGKLWFLHARPAPDTP